MSSRPDQNVHLRPYALEDADRLAVLLNDPDVTAMTSSIPYPYARSDAEAFLSDVRNEDGRKVSRAITRDGALVGGIGFGPRPGGHEEIGYWVGKPHWGQGIATVAVGVFVELLDALGIDGDIEARTVASNEASQKVLINNGFAYRGEGECITPARAQAKMAAKLYVLERLGKPGDLS
ncbi:MAG: GNAT family N-acetyltransferase [Pseudomonadota bacterium]